MKSSRLSPAGRLQGGACMPGSRSADSGCAGGSSGCPLWGRREEGRALQGLGCLCPLGPTWVGEEGTAVGGGQGQLRGAPGPRKQATGAPSCRLPMPAPRGTMGCLLGPRQELRVGVGEGRPSKEEGRLARSGPAGQSLGQARWPAPLGLSLHSQPAPPEERQRELGQLAREAPGARDLVSVPSASPSPCASICSPAGTRGSSGSEGGVGRPWATARSPTHCRAGPRFWGAECGGISRQQEPLLLSSEEYQLSCSASLAQTDASEGSRCQ